MERNVSGEEATAFTSGGIASERRERSPGPPGPLSIPTEKSSRPAESRGGAGRGARAFDPEYARAAALRYRLRFHTERMPRLRVVWYAGLAVVAGLQNAALGEAGMPLLWCSSLIAAAGLAFTALVHWLVGRATSLARSIGLAELALVGDLLLVMLAAWLSGGSNSVLVIALLAPAAFQAARGMRACLLLGAAAAVAYAVLVAGSTLGGIRLDAATTFARLGGLLLGATAAAVGAREVDRLRRRDGGALRLAHARVTELEDLMAGAQAERAWSGAADRARGEILADIGHEIRTPMTSIIGLSKLCLDGENDPTRREHLRLVQGSAGSLLRTVDDLIDLSELETGQVHLSENPFDLRQLLADKLPALEARAFEKGLSLHCRVAREVPEMLVGDGLRLAQVIGRLAHNAVRATESGSVAVRADMERDGALVLRVIDTGAGYEPDAIERLLHGAPGESGAGQGLGLALLRRLVAAMGGRLEAISAPGTGSEFRVVLRLPISPEQPARSLPVGTGRRVLLAASDAVEGACLSELIEESGATLEHWSGGKVPDVAGVATGTPALVVVDGAAVQADPTAFRTLVETLPPRRVVVVTSLADQATGDALRPLGDRVLRLDRPVLAPSFEQLLREVADAGRGSGKPTARPSSPGSTSNAVASIARRSARPMRLLLAEDDAANRRLFRAVLEGWGHEVVAEEDGAAAVERFRESSFDAVLMDLQLPILNGFDATRRLRSMGQAGASVPILALTSSSLAEEAERCAEAGLDGHLSKPIDLPALFAWLEHQAGRVGGAA